MYTDANAVTHLAVRVESVGLYRCENPNCYWDEVLGTESEKAINVRVTQKEAIAGVVGTCPGCGGDLVSAQEVA